MAPQNVGPCPSSFSNKLFPGLATLFNPFLHLASSLQTSSSTHHPKPHMNGSKKPAVKRRKTVAFSAQVEMRHVDEHDESVLDVETRDLHPASDEEDPDYLDLTNAARNIDKNLLFLSRKAYDEYSMPVTAYPAEKTWKYGELDKLLRHYTDGDMAKDMSDAAHKFQGRTSSILLALSRMLKMIEEVKEAQDRELGEAEDREDEQSSDDEDVGEMVDHTEAQDDQEENGVTENDNDDGENADGDAGEDGNGGDVESISGDEESASGGDENTNDEDDQEDIEDEPIRYMVPRTRRNYGQARGRRINRRG
ncbi:predicted protein [Chaetomium globosum CBS 148.51]|uniref:Uncharacterized protein n=1 Tax=Chaetomium globosum (strain ATCC 6205 / CBS 148.51 / DSM 1962 / NBRC 6347 / NRRL 1970) TaxID=306901 RepID=Q2HF22_CHAGB|nr:uncharacterized protein CHGG_01182 [Chaetomium globosum CBS 148.51]EAQ92947.1 predicted protein [Chaetomium globosum CBS 148.51]